MKQPTNRGEDADIDFATIFAANIHEIKNLLFLHFNAIEGASNEDWARDNPAAKISLSRIKYGSSQIGQRLAHVLALYRIAQGRYELDIDYHDACEVLREIVVETHSLMDDRGIEISIGNCEGLYGFFDREMVRGILVNAVHNSLHYAKGKVLLSAALEDGFLRFRVEDDSPGYPSEVLENGGRRAKLDLCGGGTGLGLYFSATVAALHRNQGKSGFIHLSNGGALNGAVFTLCLP
ncbi:MAG: HAMP domain-containing sensor histidine kinase [Sulfurimicrobium sp.]|nr:HAMP domain-containing sensor histidine kinase [Sulfurimicrobium sp.]